MTFKKLGTGACGVILRSDDLDSDNKRPQVLKLSKAEYCWQVVADYKRHIGIARAMKLVNREIPLLMLLPPRIYLPEYPRLVPSVDKRLFRQYPDLEEIARKLGQYPTPIIISERIPSVSIPLQCALAKHFCPINLRAAAMTAIATSETSNCLVRVYLGSADGKSDPSSFTLQNFELHLNYISQLGLDMRPLVDRAAWALAVLHWTAKTDARGIEFVLGGTTARSYSTPDLRTKLHTPQALVDVGKLDFWILDFDQVGQITFDSQGVAKAVEAAYANDPYAPRPPHPSQEPASYNLNSTAWIQFCTSYRRYSKRMLQTIDDGLDDLPDLFLTRFASRVLSDMPRGYHNVTPHDYEE